MILKVCIIDDREDVWNFAPNLIHVKPYHFFRHTGDINAPPGLSKKDQDDKTGFQFEGDQVQTSTRSTPNLEGNDETSGAEAENGPTKNTNLPVSTTTDDEKKLQQAKDDLNLSDEDSETNDTEKEDAAVDADMEESNDDEGKLVNAVIDQPDVAQTDTESLVQDESGNTSTENPLTSKLESAQKEDSESSETVADSESALENTVQNDSLDKVPVDSEMTDTQSTDKLVKDLKIVKEPDEVNPTSTPSVENTIGNSDTNDSKTPTEDNQQKLSERTDVNNIDEKKIEQGSSTPKVIEVEDEDDYLLYLEQILKSIHDAFYSLYDDMVKRKEVGVPDVKTVIPYVRKKILSKVCTRCL